MNMFKKCKSLKRRLEKAFFWRLGRFLFKMNGITYGKNLICDGIMLFDIAQDADVQIGDDCFFNSGWGVNPLSGNKRGDMYVRSGAFIKIGNNCGFSSPIFFIHKGLTIGNYVNVGANVIFLDSDCHSLFFKDRRCIKDDERNKKDREIIIEDDVLIGMNSQILKGVHIGARSVIGAGSVVTKDVPSDCIAAGNPAVIIKKM